MKSREVVRISASQLVYGQGQEDIDYQLDRSPFTRYYWNGTAFTEVGAGASSAGVFRGPYAWATKPTSGLTVGDTIRITDVGFSPGVIFMWTGARWRRLYPFVLVSNISSLATPIQALTGVTSGTYTLPTAVVIPAGMLTAGDRFLVRATFIRSGTTATNDLNVYLGTAGTTSDSVVRTDTMSATNNRVTDMVVRCLVTADASFTTLGGTTLNTSGTNTMSDRSTNVDFTAAMTMTCALAAANVADSFKLIEAGLEIL